jgi:hypothetical protein
METVYVTLPIAHSSGRIYPVDGREVVHPNEILDQVLKTSALAPRKIFYSLLSMDHLSGPDRLDYRVRFLDLFKGRKNIPSRGAAIREQFQNTSFAVHPKFVTVHLKKKVSEEPYISPFSMVDFVEGCWEMRLTREFKTYLNVFQSMVEKKFHFTKGDIRHTPIFPTGLSAPLWTARIYPWEFLASFIRLRCSPGLKFWTTPFHLPLRSPP